MSKPARSFASPSPHPGVTSIPQPPIFYPPSYYAAASGIPYPRKLQTNSVQPSLASVSDQHDTAIHYEQFMPVSYTPNTSSSESSFEFSPSRPTSRSKHRDHAHAPKTIKREKRQSQITGLPQIEAHLLPSLRDTVVRMTRPPSRIAPSQSAFTPSGSLHETQHIEPYELPDVRNHPSDFSSNAYDARSTHKYISPRDPPPSDDACSVKSLTPKPKVESLRSALRTPTPRSFQGQETPRSEFGENSVRGPSFRPVKSPLARKMSTKSTATSSSVGSPRRPILKFPAQTPRQGPSSQSPSLHDHRQPTNYDNHQSPLAPPLMNDRSDPQAQKQSRSPQPPKRLPSNIPRFRARLAFDHAQYQSSESSDFECRYERERRDQRKLTVANVDVLSNSSSSYDSDNHKHPSRLNQLQPKVGLGLDYQFPEMKSPCIEPSRDRPDTCPNGFVTKTPRFSVISSASSDSHYSATSDDHVPPPEQTRSDHERRRAALLHIVSTLDQKPQRRATQSSESSEYHGVEGVAYSASGELEVQRERQQDPNTNSGGHLSPLSGPDNNMIGPMPLELPGPSKQSHKEHRRRSQYKPGSLPLSVMDNLHQNCSQQKQRRRESNEIGGATARLARRSLMVAAREREAFGLRPSDSEEYHQQYESLRDHSRYERRLSESSAEDLDLDEPQENTLSHGASFMLQSIQGMRSSVAHNQPVFDDGVVEAQALPGVRNRSASTVKSLLPSPPMMSTSPPRIDRPPTEELPPSPDVMDQLLETEKTFVKHMQTCIQNYVLPLRIHGSRVWIVGIPPEISRFLDWLEDILHLHEQVLEVFRGSKYDVIRQMNLFLPRFEIYQPYIARLGEVSRRLRQLMDEGSDFGHFVNLQDKEIRRSGWSLPRYISEPQKRLQKYLDLFSALLDSTPRPDPQYLHVFSLLRSMELILDVMHTVKQEEEDHQMLSTLFGLFKGPCSLRYLADRKRTLLWHGLLVLRWSVSKDWSLEPQTARDAFRTRRLSRAVSALDTNISQTLCLDGSQDSLSSYGSTSSYPSSDSRDGSPSLRPDATTSALVYAVVLSDLVVFGECVSGASASYRLLDTIGLVRVFSVDLSDSTAVSIEVIPISSAESNINNMSPHIRNLQVSESDSASGISPSRNLHQDWRSALRRSSDHTTQLWCRPWKTNKAVEKNVTTQILASLVDSGLPLPRSPSGRIPESRPQDVIMCVQEREERGWWSFRFHKVMSAKRQMV